MMDDKILMLFNGGKITELEQLINNKSDSEIMSLINRRFTHGKGDLAAVIRAIFAGLPPSKDVNNKKRLSIFKHLLSALDAQEVNPQMTTELIGLLLFEMDSLPCWCLSDLANHFVNNIKNGMFMTGKCLELFPKILSLLELQEVVSSGESEMNGTDYKSHILNSLCSGRWDVNAVIHLAAMFKDVSLSLDELGFVIHKILRMLNDVDLQELPPIIYQLLLLSTKGHKKLVLDGVISFFVDKDAQLKRQLQEQREDDGVSEQMPTEQLHHIEGTVILHVTFAIKQDQDLGREFIRYFKANQQFSLNKVLAPFNIALALSTGRIHSFEEQIFELLKVAILRGFKDSEKQQESSWVREMAPEICDVASLVLDTVKNSVIGWDHITQGLVQLGFSLMEAYGPKPCFGKTVESTGKQNPSQRACKLGSRLLLETFKTHEMVRQEIVAQLLNHIVTKTANYVSHFIELLSLAVKSSTYILLECVPKFKESFDYLAYLPMTTSEGLLKAIQPLLKMSLPLKDSLLLFLRKALFSRQAEARLAAVNGYLMLLNNFRALGGLPASQSLSQASTSSQIHVDVHTRMSDANNEALCLEILGNLRRCLSQQADVRLLLYEGLLSILSTNLQMSNSILSLLIGQFCRYYDASADGLPPVKLDLCVIVQGDQPFIAEPLSHLVSCLVHCYLKKVQCASDSDEMGAGNDEDDDHGETCKELETMLNSLTSRMIKCELEDFELDKSADYSTSSSVGVRNTIFALLVCGIFEALMEYEFLASNFEVERCQQMIQLYQSFQKLTKILKEKLNDGPSSTGTAGKAKRKRGQSKNETKTCATPSASVSAKYSSLLSLRFVAEVLRALFSDNDPAHHQSISVMVANLDFQCHILTVAVSRLQQVNQLGHCDGPDGKDTEKLVRYCMVIGRIAMKYYCEDSNTRAAATVKNMRSKTVVSSCLEAFYFVLSIFCNRHPNKLIQFLLSIDSRRASAQSLLQGENDHELIHKHILKYQQLVMRILTASDEDRSMKDVSTLMSVIGLLTRQLPPNNPHITELQDWLIKLCKEQEIDDVTVTKTVIQQLLSLSKQQALTVQIAREIATDVHIGLGDIDQEVEIVDGKKFAILGPKCLPPVLLLLLTHLEKEIEDTDWVINRLRAERGTADKSSSTQQDCSDKGICLRIGHIINAFHELLQTALPTGPCTESLIKAVSRFYATLTIFVKWSLSMYLQKAGHISSRFEKMIKLSGTNLTQCVYSMITYIQATQAEQVQTVISKMKKKGRQGVYPAGNAAVLIKESRSIPNLIYAIEQYEKFLIQLSKKSKVDLMSHFKMSTSRDFRINAAALQTAMEKNTAEEDDDDEDDEDDHKNDSEQDEDRPNDDKESTNIRKNKQPSKMAKLSSKSASASRKQGKKLARK